MKLIKRVLLCLLAAVLVAGGFQGTIIASAAPYSLQEIEQLLDTLDTPPEDGCFQEGENRIEVTGIIMARNPVMVPPVVNTIKDSDRVISGRGDAGNTIHVTFPDGTVIDAVVDQNGDWSITIPSGIQLKAGDVVMVTQENLTKLSESVYMTVADSSGNLPKEVFTKTPSAKNVGLGDSVNYTLKGIGNPYGDTVYQYSIADIPPKELMLVSGKLPAFTKGDGITYKILYNTNLANDNVLFEGLSAEIPYDFNMKSLGEGEYLTSVFVVFDEVPADFARGNEIVYNFQVTQSPENEKIVNKGYISFDLDPDGQQKQGIWNDGDSGVQVGNAGESSDDNKNNNNDKSDGSGNKDNTSNGDSNIKSPRTGDPYIEITLLVLSCSLLFILLFRERKKKDDIPDNINI